MEKKPKQKNCVICHTELVFKYAFSKKTRIFPDGPRRVNRNSYMCPNKKCKNYKKAITANSVNPKGHVIVWEVFVIVAMLRVKEELTLKKIKEKLKENYKIIISQSQIRRIADKYLQLISSRPSEQALKKLRDRGGLVLDIDGAKPEKGNHVLYLIRDLLSGEILVARTLDISNTESLADLFKEVVDFGLDIRGIVSDKQKAIVDAVKLVFGGSIPHQFCHFHFLENISTDFADADRNLRKQIRKRMIALTRTYNTSVRQLKRGAITKVQFDKLNRLYEVFRHIKYRKSKYPFEVVGIVLYEELGKIEKTIKKMAKVMDLPQFKTMLRNLKRIKEDFEEQYKVLKEQFWHLLQINELLKGGLSRKASEEALLNYVNLQYRYSKQRRSSKASRGLEGWWRTVVRQTEAWLPGLFAFLDEQLLPRTNNLMEQ